MSKISDEKNLAFADQPAPIPAREVPQQIKARPALKALESVEIDIRRLLPTGDADGLFRYIGGGIICGDISGSDPIDCH